MPGKSRQRKGKYFSQGKKGKGRLRPPVLHPQAPVAVPMPKPVSSASSTPVASMSSSRGRPIALQYPYIATELRTIGILAAIVLTILIVLALVLS